jgi:hypothetical protein
MERNLPGGKETLKDITEQVREKEEISEAIPHAARVSTPSAGPDSPASDGLSCFRGTADPGLSPARGFMFLVFRFFPCLLRDGEAAATT